MSTGDDRAIGIFDSGVGGLTVTDSIMKLLPQENLIYFGDTARCPYGPRSIDEVHGFLNEIMGFMQGQDVKMLVIACNSMTAAYEKFRPPHKVPVIGVMEPAVRAAVRATHNRKVGVLGTQATLSTGQYERFLEAAGKDLEIHTQVCGGFVERVEEGDTFSEELFALAEEYLKPLMEADVDTLILGCTHYPLLTGVLHSVTNGEVELISSADEVAKDIYSKLVELNLLRRQRTVGTRRFITSGDPESFRAVGSRFLAGLDKVESIPWGAVEGSVIGSMRESAWSRTTPPFEAIVLGASGTYPKPGGATSGFLLRVGNFTVWMDCGTGTFANLQRHTDYRLLSAVVISHLHLDHYLDFYSFYYALRYGKDSPGPNGLEVYAPAGAEEHMAKLLSPTAGEGFGGFFDFNPVRSGDKIAVPPFVFTFKRTVHPIETLAVRVEANGRSLVYTADTAWSEELIDFAQGANVLVAEATLQEPDPAGQKVHMTAEEAGRLAHDSRASRLVLTHLAPGLDPTVSMDQAAKHFRGKILVAIDNLNI